MIKFSILFLICTDLVSSSVYRITSSPTDLCPTEPCVTLSDFAVGIRYGYYLTTNMSLIFQPGNHSLNSELLIEHASNFSMLSHSIIQSSVIIKCEGYYARLSLVTSNNIYISGLDFRCRGHKVRSVDWFTIQDCVFLDHSETAVQLINSTAHITRTLFLTNTVGSFQGQTKLTQRNDMVGAAITASTSNVKITDGTFKKNSAGLGGAIYGEHLSNITILNSTFEENSVDCSDCFGGVLYTESGCTVTVLNSTFCSNYGGVFALTESTLTIHLSVFMLNEAARGGVIYSYQADKVIISESNFTENSANYSAGVLLANSVVVSINGSTFTNNRATTYAGAIEAVYKYLSISESKFINNSAKSSGGALFIVYSDIVISGVSMVGNRADYGGAIYIRKVRAVFNESKFTGNAASTLGGVVFAHETNMNISECLYTNNEANIAGVLHIEAESLFRTNKVTIYMNTANQSIVHVIHSTGEFGHHTHFSSNRGSLLLFYSHATFRGNTDFDGSISHETIWGFPQGGAITAIYSGLLFEGLSTLMYNHAESGGAIRATKSELHIHGQSNVIISDNIAADNGGGIYLYQSELYCRDQSTLELVGNSVGEKGGGIHAISSIIMTEYNFYKAKKNYLGTRIDFTDNSAVRAGGGLYLEQNSKMIIINLSEDRGEELDYTLSFTENSADYGGAIHVADHTNSRTCASTLSTVHTHFTNTECFLQMLITITPGDYSSSLSLKLSYPHFANIKFVGNVAHKSGRILFGGLLDRCSFGPFKMDEVTPKITDSVTLLASIANITNFNSIGSDPVRVCFCNDSQPDCSYEPTPICVKKGHPFTVSLVAVDQVNNTVNATIYSSLKFRASGLGEGQLKQSTSGECSHLTFSVFSPHDFEELTLYSDGPCKDTELSKGRVSIQFSSCSCPLGFQQKYYHGTKPTNCECECDSKLNNYINECNPETETLARRGTFWIAYINNSDNSSGYVIHPHCPLDYCKAPGVTVNVNLAIPNGADAQCAMNRTGILCGSCQLGFSLSLGSSRCIFCPSYWPVTLAFITIAVLLAGLVLVATILILNLTVAVGTLNGIIFYANVLNAHSSTLLPFQKPNFITVFISWLNLELGFDVCLIEGMNSYWKTWLQLIFPIYIILLVIMIIFAGERSKKFSHLIGKKNPVATLATLILLSYTKLLHTVIATMSYTVLKYPGLQGKNHRVVWLPDANVGYLRGKHIALLITAVFILLAGAIFTALLFFWQWLLRIHDKKYFSRFIRNQKLSLFIETYHIPYTSHNRYWTGLLLFVRIILYVASFVNVSGNPKKNLVTTGAIVIGVILFKEVVVIGRLNRVYKKWPIEILEVITYINLILLCLFTFFTLEDERAMKVIACISVSITFVMFLGVLFYHIFTELLAKLPYYRWLLLKKSAREYKLTDTMVTVPTCSVIDAPNSGFTQMEDQNSQVPKYLHGHCELSLREPLLENFSVTTSMK